jgi:hypothetical protein
VQLNQPSLERGFCSRLTARHPLHRFNEVRGTFVIDRPAIQTLQQRGTQTRSQQNRRHRASYLIPGVVFGKAHSTLPGDWCDEQMEGGDRETLGFRASSRFTEDREAVLGFTQPAMLLNGTHRLHNQSSLECTLRLRQVHLRTNNLKDIAPRTAEGPKNFRPASIENGRPIVGQLSAIR